MQPRTLSAALSIAIALTIPAAHAQIADPCTAFTCMAGISGVGASGGSGCIPAISVFFNIVVFDPYYDPVATAQLRRQYLMACPGTGVAMNAAVVNAIIAEWGTSL